MNRENSEIACNLHALDATERERRAELERELRAGTTAIHELSRGYAFELVPESAAARCVAEFIELESRCCPFLEIDVRAAHRDRGPTLEICGEGAVKEFVVAQFGKRIGEQ